MKELAEQSYIGRCLSVELGFECYKYATDYVRLGTCVFYLFIYIRFLVNMRAIFRASKVAILRLVYLKERLKTLMLQNFFDAIKMNELVI